MKLARTCDGRIVWVEGDRMRPLGTGAADGMEALIRRYGTDFAALRKAADLAAGMPEPLPPAFAPVVPNPGKILGIGRNYGAHAREGGLAAQERPRVFFKPGDSVSGHGETVLRPASVRKLDFEGELVVVVGTPLHDADAETSARAIFGYTIGNDLSAREFQFDVSPPQTSFAKGMTGFAAIGPVIVTADELGVAPDLGLRTSVNGVTMQQGHTGDLIFSIAECLVWISRFMTLQPGDLLFTGTPAGVGVFRDPPSFLAPGDVVRVEIDGIGVLETRIG